MRPEYRDEFDAALSAAPPDGTLRVPAFARVVSAIPVARNDGVYELEDLHPYTREQIDLRLEFRPKKPLVLLAVEVMPLRAPVDVRRMLLVGSAGGRDVRAGLAGSGSRRDRAHGCPGARGRQLGVSQSRGLPRDQSEDRVARNLGGDDRREAG